ncbi:MAG: aspartate aminotransferase, partial [Rhodospirillales bacterium]
LIAAFQRLRSYGGATLPMPVLAASAALWADEAHVIENQKLYRAKMDLAGRILGKHPGFTRPEGGFFLWLDVGDGEVAAKKLWQSTGIRVLPGAYLAMLGADGRNPGQPYIRIALVHDLATTERALSAIAATLMDKP